MRAFRIAAARAVHSAAGESLVLRTGPTAILTFLLAVSALASPLAAEAQRGTRVSRMGYLSLRPGASSRNEAFRQGLRELGYNEGENSIVDQRFAGGDVDRLRTLAKELVQLSVDVMVTGGAAATRSAREATSKIPIVMAADAGPVGDGFVESLARPGGSITGLTSLAGELSGKRLELLKETVPQLTHVAIISDPREPKGRPELRETEDAARTFGTRIRSLEVRPPRDLTVAFEVAKRERIDALILLAASVVRSNRIQIAKLAAEYRIPAMSEEAAFAHVGGLLAYGASDDALHRRAAWFVDRILKGAKPVDLPIEQPTQSELVLNLKTAKALGLTIPQSVLLRADEVIR